VISSEYEINEYVHNVPKQKLKINHNDRITNFYYMFWQKSSIIKSTLHIFKELGSGYQWI